MRTGWQPRNLMVRGSTLTILEQRVPMLGGFWYLPEDSGLRTVEALEELINGLYRYARGQGVFAVRVEPTITNYSENVRAMARLGFKKAATIQPDEATVCPNSKSPLRVIEAELLRRTQPEVTELIGTWDFPFRPSRHSVWKHTALCSRRRTNGSFGS
ncbi:hypothetical protein IWX75_000596 [Arthrobacter sp. CAN_A6]